MKARKPWPFIRDGGATGAALSALVGLAFLIILPMGDGLSHLSYDLLFLFRANVPVNDAVILYMDEASEDRLGGQPWDRWDRSVHARLLQALAGKGVRMVVFDVVFDSPGANLEANAELVNAAKDFGKVAVAAQALPIDRSGEVIGWKRKRPFEKLAEVTSVGLVEVADENKAIREHYRNREVNEPTLAWCVANAIRDKAPADPFAARWINYYGPRCWIPYFSYAEVLSNFTSWAALSNKLVFVGSLRTIGPTGGMEIDEFRTPYTRWTPGVEILATAALNLIREDWLRRLSPVAECLVMVLTGAALGWGLTPRRPMAAAGWGILAGLCFSGAAIVLTWQTYIWFPWMIVLAAQMPCAVGWAVLTHFQRLLREKKLLEHRLVMAGEAPQAVPMKAGDPRAAMARSGVGAVDKEAPAVSPSAAVTRGAEPAVVITPVVPDHELLLRIGQGAYGEVWLARDILGTFHAAKIVYRKNFGDAAPFEREFNGLKRFTPVSRAHPGLVNILHVGRHPDPDYIYYIMELGDDETAGQHIDPKSYSPKTLAKELKRRKRLPLRECLQLSMDLASALEFLHQQHLIHRDVKPSNIIFVRGVPKLADIGLVTEIAERASDVSYVGTRGYIPPEGPGTPAADVYSLGKVIYEAALGMECSTFPQLPATLLDQTEGPELVELNQIILRACENDPHKRFHSAAELQAALAELLRRGRSAPQ